MNKKVNNNLESNKIHLKGEQININYDTKAEKVLNNSSNIINEEKGLSFKEFLKQKKNKEEIKIFRFIGGRLTKKEKIKEKNNNVHNELGSDNLKIKFETFFRKDLLSYLNKICNILDIGKISLNKKIHLEKLNNIKPNDYINNSKKYNANNLTVFNNLINILENNVEKYNQFNILYKMLSQFNMNILLYQYYYKHDSFNLNIKDKNGTYHFITLKGKEKFIEKNNNCENLSARLEQVIKKLFNKWGITEDDIIIK